MKRAGNQPITTNQGIGKQLPDDEAGTLIPAQPRNRKERRALQAWHRKQQQRNNDAKTT